MTVPDDLQKSMRVKDERPFPYFGLRCLKIFIDRENLITSKWHLEVNKINLILINDLVNVQKWYSSHLGGS